MSYHDDAMLFDSDGNSIPHTFDGIVELRKAVALEGIAISLARLISMFEFPLGSDELHIPTIYVKSANWESGAE